MKALSFMQLLLSWGQRLILDTRLCRTLVDGPAGSGGGEGGVGGDTPALNKAKHSEPVPKPSINHRPGLHYRWWPMPPPRSRNGSGAGR